MKHPIFCPLSTITITPLLVDITNGIALDFFVTVQVESRHCVKENKKQVPTYP